MKQLTKICILFIAFATQLSSQVAPDFTITDSDDIEHTLYEDYLDKGMTVVIKFFFVDCPPCNGIAPSVQELYEEWGEGQYDVQFIELSTKSSDSNAKISGYKTRHSITFPGAGGEGNAQSAISPYSTGNFGTFFGTPSFAVIAPDKSVVYNTGGAGNAGKITNLDQAIKDTGAQGIPGPEPSVYNLDISDAFGNADDSVEIYLEDVNNPSNSYQITGRQLIISNLEDDYPGIVSPVLRFSKEGDPAEKVSPLDLLIMRKHLLAIINIDDPAMVLAADANADGDISPLDMLIMRKFILNIITEFPEGTYKFLPAELPLNLLPGQTQNLEVISVKMGDLNGI